MFYTTLDKSEFITCFQKSYRFDSWSIEGLSTLYDYINDDDEMEELDIVLINSCWCEYENLSAAYRDQFHRKNETDPTPEEMEERYQNAGVVYLKIPHTDRVVVFTDW